jgi:hypothetical protein
MFPQRLLLAPYRQDESFHAATIPNSYVHGLTSNALQTEHGFQVQKRTVWTIN